MEDATTATNVFAIAEDSILVATLAVLFDNVKKHNQGKYSDLARFSREAFIERVVETGIGAMTNALEADIDRRNKDAYVKAMASLPMPVSDKLEDLQKYQKQVGVLRLKYRIGADPKEV